MKKIFYFTAILFATILCLSSCDRNNEDVNITLSQTSWESAINDSEFSGMLTLSFTDAENGIVRGNLEDKNGNNYTVYYLFTYDELKGNSVLHVNSEYGISDDGHICEMFCNLDFSMNVDKQANYLVLADADEQMTFTRTDYIPLFCPSTSAPELSATNVKLTDNLLKGTWESLMPVILHFKIDYQPVGSGYNVWVMVESRFGMMRSYIVDSRTLNPIIENDSTLALYADRNHTKLDYYLVFGDKLPDLEAYPVKLFGAERNEIARDNGISKVKNY